MFILDAIVMVFVAGWMAFAGLGFYAPDTMYRLFPSMSHIFPVPHADASARHRVFWRIVCGFFIILGGLILTSILSGRLSFAQV